MKVFDRFRIRLFGGFEVVAADGSANPVRLSTRKECALLAVLALSRNQRATRDELARLLWGGCSQPQGRQSLRQALTMLRKDLRSAHVLSADRNAISLQPGSWSVDALEFARLGQSSAVDDLKRAIELYRGEFLADVVIDEER